MTLAPWTGFGTAAAQTLDQALALAYQNNPTLLGERAALRATDEGVSQALAGWRPTIQFEGDAGVSDISTLSNFGGGGSAETDDTLNPYSYSVSVVEPLYRGGRTVAETESAENLVDAGRAQLTVVEQTVMLDAVTAYMDVLQIQSELELNRNNERVVRRQLEAAQDRFEVGEVTRTDVAQAEARLAQAAADRVTAEGNLISARAIYRQVISDLPGELAWPEFPSGVPGSEQDALTIANDANPSIAAADSAERAARSDVDVAFSTLLPQVSVRGSYSEQFDQSSFTEETTTASLTANVTVPFYQSGAEHSQVRQAKQVAAQRRLDIDRARRDVLEEVTRAWESLVTAQAQITAFESQVRAAEIALDGVEQEALVGLRTTLDVLDAEQELFGASVNLVRAQRDEIVAAYWVKSTIGELTAQRLGLPVDLYDVSDHYNEVRGKWFGLGD
jgi:TolC family type I secretion outer membrane protein